MKRIGGRIGLMCLLIGSLFCARSQPYVLTYPELSGRIARAKGLSSLWGDTSFSAIRFRGELIHHIDSLYRLRLIARPYQSRLASPVKALPSPLSKDASFAGIDFIDACVAASFDLFRGADHLVTVGYDVVTPIYRSRDDSLIEEGIKGINSEVALLRWFSSLEPVHQEYHLIKKAFLSYQKNRLPAKGMFFSDDTLQSLQRSLYHYRWLFHFGLEDFLLVNVPAAQLDYYEKGDAVLSMRTIVGKPTTPTPRFASFCRQLILYPYWYVPSSIALGEYLSNIQRDPGWLDDRNMQVIDDQGRVVDPHRLNWRSFSEGHFPYTIRQSTGCDNALGVLKFDVETPYGVYLHDTNNKAAFLRANRFLSHGCIRIEEPLLLGNKLVKGGLDTAYLQSCFVDKKPVARPLERPLAVFSLYLPATVNKAGRLLLWPDPYRLFENH